MPLEQSRFLKKILTSLFILIPLLVLIVVLLQKPFNPHTFELGNVKEFTGVYYEKPVPILVVSEASLPKGVSNSILLVGYGKFGAEGIMTTIEEKNGKLNGKKVTLSGTLIYGSAKTLLELTKKENSLISIDSQPIIEGNILMPKEITQLTGEILDPKCYFGVMKPGEGKVHRSCAIRCISGGIPPVFRVHSLIDDKKYDYYILLGENGEKINKDVLSYVGQEVSLTGGKNHQQGWNILYVNTNSIAKVEY